MSTFTQHNTEITWEVDGGAQHSTTDGGMTIALEHWPKGLDTTDLFKELPDGACQEQHWGYVVSGSITMTYTDGSSETITGGQAYYIKPGHNGHVDEEIDLVEFTPANQTPDQAPGTNLLG
jgi:hypothetical protein